LAHEWPRRFAFHSSRHTDAHPLCAAAREKAVVEDFRVTMRYFKREAESALEVSGNQ